MLRALTVTLLICITGIVPAAQGQDDPLTREERAWLSVHGPIVYGYEPNYAPFEFVDHRGQAGGINFDMLDAMARRLDIPIDKVQYQDFDELLAGAANGTIDVLGTVNRTSERESFLDFSDPYVRLASVFYVTDADIKSIDDLEGRRVGVVETYVSGEWLAGAHPELDLVGYPDLDALLGGLTSGQVDAVFEESATVGYMARQNGLTNVHVLGDGAFLQSDQHFAVPDGQTILVGIINKGLQAIAPGEQTRIFEFWTGYDLGVYRPPQTFSPIARNVLIGIGGVALVAFMGVVVLRREVARKTSQLQEELTRRRQAEAAVLEEKSLLEQRVQERTLQLERSNQDLQEFAGTVSHDLQSPLSVIALKGRLVRSAGKDDPALSAYGEKIEEMVVHMKEIIRASLAYSKAKAHHELRPVALHEVVGRALSTLEPAILDSGAKVTVDRIPPVMGSESQLLQLFQNLIGNAIKYRRDEPPRIHVWSEAGDGHHTIHVQDNGTGFDASHLPDMMAPGVRLSEHRDRSGHGLGLAACARIVERHGGHLGATSTLGEGSTFTVRLPEMPAEEAVGLDAIEARNAGPEPARRGAPA